MNIPSARRSDIGHRPRRGAGGRQNPAAGQPRRQAIKDRFGLDLRPDPGQVRTAAELLEALRECRLRAGDVPYRQMAEGCGQLVSASTLQRALMPATALPPLEVVRAVILGCGGSDEDERRFATAWRQVSLPGRQAANRGQRVVR